MRASCDRSLTVWDHDCVTRQVVGDVRASCPIGKQRVHVEIGILVAALGIIGAVVAILDHVSALKARQTRRPEHFPPGDEPPIPALRFTSSAPRPPDDFSGREDELARRSKVLTSNEDQHATVIYGMPGIGKTTLASMIAERWLASATRPSVVLWGRCTAPLDKGNLLRTWLQQLREGYGDFDDTVLANLVRHRLEQFDLPLVVLDDVWESERDLVMSIWYDAIPANARVVVTTRELHVARWIGNRPEPALGPFSADEAIAYLEKHLGALDANKQAADEVAELVGYLPLALQVVAAAAGSPNDLADLARELREGRRNLDEVDAALAFSVARLDLETQRCFRSLGAFAEAPFRKESALRILGSVAETSDPIKKLVDASLLGRYNEHTLIMHSLVHGYAKNLLQQSGEAEVAGRRHAEYYRDALEGADSTRQVFDDELAQITQGWNYAGCQSLVDQRLQLGYYHAARWVFHRYGRWDLQLAWACELLDHPDLLDHPERQLSPTAAVDLLLDMSSACFELNDYEELTNVLNRCMSTADQADVPIIKKAICLNWFGVMYRELAEFDKAIEFTKMALRINREEHNRIGEAWSLHNISMIRFRLHSYPGALRPARRGLVTIKSYLETTSHDDWDDDAQEAQIMCFNLVGRIHFTGGKFSSAKMAWSRALELAIATDKRIMIARLHRNLGRLEHMNMNYEAARRLYESALDAVYKRDEYCRHQRLAARTLRGIAMLDCAQEDCRAAYAGLEEALRLCSLLTGYKREQVLTGIVAGIVLFRLARYDEALRYLGEGKDSAEILQMKPQTAVAWHYMAEANRRLGDTQNASTADQSSEERLARIGMDLAKAESCLI